MNELYMARIDFTDKDEPHGVISGYQKVAVI